MKHTPPSKNLQLVKFAICILAVAMNILTSYFFMNFLRFPLFLDTVFTAAVTFSLGLMPGLSVAVFGLLLPGIYYNSFNPFVLCSIAEVLLIHVLKPADPEITNYSPKEKIIASYSVVAAKLMLLYIICAVTISILGGVINYIYDMFWETYPFYSPEDTFKLNLIMSNIPSLAVNILSRIPINMVDRFIVIFGGYFISRGISKVKGKREEGKRESS